MKYSYTTRNFYSKETIEKVAQFYGDNSDEFERAKDGDTALPGRIKDDIDEEKSFLNELICEKAFLSAISNFVDKKPVPDEHKEVVKDAIASINQINALSDIYQSAVTDRAFQRQIEAESRKRER